MQEFKTASVLKTDQLNLNYLTERHVMHGSGKPYGVIKDYTKKEFLDDHELFQALSRRTTSRLKHDAFGAKNSNPELHILIDPDQ